MVFSVKVSLKRITDNMLNTIIPTAKPISLLGQISPPQPSTKKVTDFIYNQLTGILDSSMTQRYLSYQLYFKAPCNCMKEPIWPKKPNKIPKTIFVISMCHKYSKNLWQKKTPISWGFWLNYSEEFLFLKVQLTFTN